MIAPLALILASTIGTASAWQTAAARWERLAMVERAHHEETRARLATEQARVRDAVARGALATAKADGRAAALSLDLATERERAATLVTPSRVRWAAGGAAACAGGLVASVAGLALRKEALGYGGAAVAAGGCAVLGWMW